MKHLKLFYIFGINTVLIALFCFQVSAKSLFTTGAEVQQAIDEARPYETIQCDPNRQLIISKPLIINKPLTIRGLNATLPDSLGFSAILQVESKGVTILDFNLRGNANTVPQTERTALIQVFKGDFRIERCYFENSSKEGISVDPRENTPTIDGGVIRDIVGRGCVRDVISLGGPAGKGPWVKNVLVENVRGYDSSMRGPLEVSDGCSNITVRKIYAENCVYAVDVQDHHKEEINRYILIEDVYAYKCERAIRTANHLHGHTNLIIRDVTADQCTRSLQISNTNHVILENIRIRNFAGDEAVFNVSNCDYLTIRDVTLENSNSKEIGVGLMIENCNEVTIEGVRLAGSNKLTNAVKYRISDGRDYKHLQISSVSSQGVSGTGIILENESSTLSNYMISNNLTSVEDRIKGKQGVISNNIAN